MHMLNRYFAPFALFLILSAIWFSEPEPRDYKLSLAILAVSAAVNWWLDRNAYRFMAWSRRLRGVQICSRQICRTRNPVGDGAQAYG